MRVALTILAFMLIPAQAYAASGQIEIKVEGMEYSIKAYSVKNGYGSTIGSNSDCMLCGSWARAYGEYGEYTVELVIEKNGPSKSSGTFSFKVNHQCNRTEIHIGDLSGSGSLQGYCY